MSDLIIKRILAFLLLHNAFYLAFDWHYMSPVLKKNISLETGSTNHYSLYVPMEQPFEVSFEHFKTEGSQLNYEAILGNKNWDNTGMPLEYSWQLLLPKDANLIASDEGQSDKLCGYSNSSYYKCLGEFKVPSGEYILKFNLGDIPAEFRDIKTEIHISFNFKHGHTWHTAYTFWAAIFTMLIGWPVSAILIFILLYRKVKGR